MAEVVPGQPTGHLVRVVGMKPSGFSAESLAEVFRCRRSELVRLGAFILGDRQGAEDVVQDVFLRMYQRGGRLADLDDPWPYLRGAVLNGCRSVLRRRLLIRRHAGKDQPCPPLSAEEAMLLSEDRRQVLAALARLPARRREVLVLRYYAGLALGIVAAVDQERRAGQRAGHHSVWGGPAMAGRIPVVVLHVRAEEQHLRVLTGA
jgi:RNA polymerase sigma factor (sigma-70 family)